MADIVLCTLNARYQHTAFGLRCLRANLGELEPRSVIVELDSNARAADVVEAILAHQPRLVGLGVYVWNVVTLSEVVELLAQLAPQVFIVLGGPEVSFELDAQPWTKRAHAIVAGEGEWHFKSLCESVLQQRPPERRVFASHTGPLANLTLPYAQYSDDDLKNRVLYVEASRGCPYSCEFCLSSLDERVRSFPLEALLAEFSTLIDRGARHFKFVDRTFNLDVKASTKLLEFFLEKVTPDFLLHFEMVPDRFPPALREVVQRFPPGVLQFEVGIQTFDPQVARLISRRMDVEKTRSNLQFLREHHVHVHADLIAGLPSETLASFASGFDQLLAMGPHEIQVGILKRLRGAPIDRHTGPFQLTWASRAPYEVVQTSTLSFSELQHLKRFASLWDAVGNSGNFTRTLPLLWSTQPSAFAAFSDFVKQLDGQTSFSLLRLMQAMCEHLIALGLDEATVRSTLLEDYRRGGRHEVPGFLSASPKKQQRALFGTRQLRHRA